LTHLAHGISLHQAILSVFKCGAVAVAETETQLPVILAQVVVVAILSLPYQ
jgi:hypothetical protein